MGKSIDILHHRKHLKINLDIFVRKMAEYKQDCKILSIKYWLLVQRLQRRRGTPRTLGRLCLSLLLQVL